jgi:hypothetical protein
MLYENTLLKTFDSKYNDLLVKQELDRKNIATMIYCFYTCNKSAINYYIKQYMLNSGIHDSRVWDSQMQLLTTVPDGSNQVGMFTEKTVKIMPKIHIDLVNKVLDMVCTIYNAGADRYLMTENKVDESATEKLMSIYNGFNAAKLIVDIYKQGYIFNTVLVQPVWRNEKIELDIITPNFCSVNSYDDDYMNIESVMISKSIEDEDKIVYWSDTEHYYLDANGNKEAVTDENGKSNGMKNPYGELPFAVLRFQSSSDFWGEPQQDLIENNIWYDVQESNKFFVEMFQGLGVGLGINLGKNGTVSLSPNTLICVDKVRAEDQTPSLNFSSTGAPLAELRDSLDYFYKRIGNSKGLSAQSMTNDVSDQSGISKAYDSAELQIKKDSHKIVMKAFESELWDKIKLVYNYNAKDKIPDGLTFRIDIVEDEPMINVSDEIAITEFKLEKNMISIVDLMIKDNPDLQTEDAMKILEENKKLNEKYLTLNNQDNGKEKTGSTSAGSNTAGDNTSDPAQSE